MKRKYLFAIPAVILFLFGFFLILIAFNPSYTQQIVQFTTQHLLIGPLLLILWRILGIIIPTIPAGVISFAVVPFFGWVATYFYTLIGILIGTSLSFWLARSFRRPLVKKFLTLQKIHQMEDEMSKKQEFLAIVAIRLFTTPIMDFSSYIAGLTKISFKKFLLATIIASLPNLAIFYFGEEFYKRVFARNLAIGVTCLFFVALFYYILKRSKKRK